MSTKGNDFNVGDINVGDIIEITCPETGDAHRAKIVEVYTGGCKFEPLQKRSEFFDKFGKYFRDK